MGQPSFPVSRIRGETIINFFNVANIKGADPELGAALGLLPGGIQVTLTLGHPTVRVRKRSHKAEVGPRAGPKGWPRRRISAEAPKPLKEADFCHPLSS